MYICIHIYIKHPYLNPTNEKNISITKQDSTYVYLLHKAQDIECKCSFWECKFTVILHGSTTDCTAVVSVCLLTVEHGRINGGKLVLSFIYLCNSFVQKIYIFSCFGGILIYIYIYIYIYRIIYFFPIYIYIYIYFASQVANGKGLLFAACFVEGLSLLWTLHFYKVLIQDPLFYRPSNTPCALGYRVASCLTLNPHWSFLLLDSSQCLFCKWKKTLQSNRWNVYSFKCEWAVEIHE